MFQASCVLIFSLSAFIWKNNTRDEQVCSLATQVHLLFDVINEKQNHLDRSLFVSAKTARVHEVIFLLFAFDEVERKPNFVA